MDVAADHVNGRIRIPSFYKSDPPIQDFINMYAAFGNRRFMQFLHAVDEIETRLEKVVPNHDLLNVAVEYRKKGMHCTADVVVKAYDLIHEKRIGDALPLVDCARAQLQSFVGLFRSAKWHSYFRHISLREAASMGKNGE